MDFPKPLLTLIPLNNMSFTPKKIALKVFFIIIFTFNFSTFYAQCFEIESILVDACGSPEGENEMVRFKVGSTALNTTNLTVNWPNNAWLGICQSVTTALKVDTLNNSIQSCGILLEPVGGVLPAGADVILITSTNVNVTANSFTNLSDTMYVLFQCAGNTAGHFVNYSSIPGLRTLSMSFNPPINCNDTVIYDKSLLVNQNGLPGGSTSIKNGALVNFDSAGNATYANQGCQAPFVPNFVQANTTSNLTICPGDSINLFTTNHGVQFYFWNGNNGSFSNPNGDSTIYYSSTNDTSSFNIIVGGVTICNDTVYDSLLVNITPRVTVTITGNDTLNLCQGQSLNLTANGATNYTWNTGSTINPLQVSSGGLYSVVGSNGCFSDSDSVFVNLIPIINIIISNPDTINICQGDSVTLLASGAPNYLWSPTGSTLDSITVSNAGYYQVTTSNSCFSASDSVLVNITPPINVSILESDTSTICVGDSIMIHAIGSINYTWSNGITNVDSISINAQGYYYVAVANTCFTDTAFFQVNVTPNITVNISEPDTVKICQGDNVVLHANGASNYLWSTNQTSDSISVNSQGYYTLTAVGNCPSNTDSTYISVLSPLNLSIIESNPSTICNGDSLTLHATGGVNYIWNTLETSDSISITNAGLYYVSASNGVCPIVSDSINIIADFIPSASIVGDSLVCMNSSIILTAVGQGTFTWSNGVNGSQTTVSTTQQLILTASNSCNNSVSDTLNITASDCSIPVGVFIPNVLTPNNDHSNDLFKIEATNLKSMEGSIYNRWGKLLFVWNDINAGWDGTYNGKIVSEGSYLYVIKVTFTTEKTQNYTGVLLLLK